MGYGELPPRARRIPDDFRDTPGPDGTTSACAENTHPTPPENPRERNYLRVRGEYRWWFLPQLLFGELPPRARRIPCCPRSPTGKSGTTSACAENTRQCCGFRLITGNYLRVRGEYYLAKKGELTELELPPRARRIQTFGHAGSAVSGTTSACAENTTRGATSVYECWNYLRVRGEYASN